MRERLKELPEALQRQVVIRLGLGTGFLLLCLVICLCFRDLYLSLPCILLAAFLIVNGSWLFYNGVTGRYVRIQGICKEIETTGIRKRIRYIYILLEQSVIKIPVRQRMRKLVVGDAIIIYLSDKEPVYEQDDGYLVCGYFALERRKEENGRHGIGERKII